MKPSEFQKTIQCQFDCLTKRVVKGTVKNYEKELSRRSQKEIPFCELPEMTVESFSTFDEYCMDKNIFHICDTEIRVLDEQLFSILEKLPEKKRDVILMFYFLGMSDTEIAKSLKMSRIASFKSRKQSLDTMRGILKEN